MSDAATGQQVVPNSTIANQRALALEMLDKHLTDPLQSYMTTTFPQWGLKREEIRGPVAEDNNSFWFPFVAPETARNTRGGNMHGGLVLTMMDTLASYHVYAARGGSYAHASSNVSAQYYKAVPIGCPLVLKTWITKMGRSLVFVETAVVDVSKKNKPEEVLVKASIVKAAKSGNKL